MRAYRRRATVASQDVNFCLIPEIPFKLTGDGGFLNVLKKRILQRAHAVIVVAEGAGQNLLMTKARNGTPQETSSSGTSGCFLREKSGLTSSRKKSRW